MAKKSVKELAEKRQERLLTSTDLGEFPITEDRSLEMAGGGFLEQNRDTVRDKNRMIVRRENSLTFHVPQRKKK